MKYRKFGRTEWMVSEIGYGMWGMAGWTGSDDEESFNSLQLAVDLGCNFFDTAWGYGSGKSENILGQLVRANKDKKLYTATKIPPKNLKWPARPEYLLDDCYPPDHIEEYVEHGLRGIEVYHYKHKPYDIKKYLRIAEKYSLIVTGGSDCHGSSFHGAMLMGKSGVNFRILEELKSESKNFI